MKADGSTNKGAFGRAVRLISESEYQLILQLGFASPTVRQPEYDDARVAEEPTEYQRPIVEQLVSRPFRDVAFTKNIRTIYDSPYAEPCVGVRVRKVVKAEWSAER